MGTLKKLNENIINKFIGSFFDSYQKGLDDNFRKKAEARDPELGKRLEKIDKSLAELRAYLKTLEK